MGRVAPGPQVLASAGVAAHLLPVRVIGAVQRGEGDVGQQRRDDPTLRCARHRPLKAAGFRHHSGFEERPHELQDALVPDTALHFTQDLGVGEPVKARLDVRLDHPLIVRGGLREVDDLGDRVVGPAAGPVAVGRRVEAALEDRLQDELEGHLNDPVLDRRNPQATRVAIAFGDPALADGRRPETALLQLPAQFAQEPLGAELPLDAMGGEGVHTSRA